MAVKTPQNCWDFWKCPEKIRKNCPACWTNLGRECWKVANSYKDSHRCPRGGSMKACWKCAWYKEINKKTRETADG